MTSEEKKTTDTQGAAEVMAGVTGDLRDLHARTEELERHLQDVLGRSQYPDHVEQALWSTIDRLVTVDLSLRAALEITTPMALDLIAAQKEEEA